MQDDSKQLLDYQFIYLIGTVHSFLHLIVGIIWENVKLPRGETALLSLPYFGGYLSLVAISLLLIFLYLALSLRKQPEVPIHIRKFCLTLSIIITVGSLILFTVMCIRTNDYRIEKDSLAKSAYYGAVLMTVVDILATIFILPSYIYLTLCSLKLVKQMEGESEKRCKDNVNSPGTDRNLANQQHASDNFNRRDSLERQEVITINDNFQVNINTDQDENDPGNEHPEMPTSQQCQMIQTVTATG